MGNYFNDWQWGFLAPLKAAGKIVSSPSLLMLSIIPSLITLILMIYFFSVGSAFLSLKVEALLTWLSLDPNAWVGASVLFLATGLVFILSVALFFLVANLVAAPFNDFLAERAERFSDPVLEPVPFQGILIFLKILGIDLVKNIFTLGISIFLFLLSWVPLLNFLAYFLFALLMALQFLSYPQTRRKIGLVRSLNFISQNFFLSLGFGMAVSLGAMIPFAGFIMIPLSVVGGTLVYARGSSK
jgi:CysZ protein